MTDFATEPLSFSGAQRYLQQKAVLPTRLRSAEISNRLPARFRSQSFLSATVEKDAVLRRMKSVTEAIASGKVGYARGRELLKEFLPSMGYAVPKVNEAGERSIRNVGSSARLDLILRQNVAMAHAVGQREISENPEVRAIFPNYRYIAVRDANTRSSHAALDGLVLPKDHPFWNTHYPPWEFNCRCEVIDTDEPVNGAAIGFTGGGASERQRDDADQTGRISRGGQTVNLTPNESGFVFRSSPREVFAEPDDTLIQDESLRADFRRAWRERFAPSDFDQAAAESRTRAATERRVRRAERGEV